MFLEKINEVRAAEEKAAQMKSAVQVKVKTLLSDAKAEGARAVAEAEEKARSEALLIEKKAKEKAEAVLEAARTDSKLISIAKKVDAELNLPEAVMFIVKETLKYYGCS